MDFSAGITNDQSKTSCFRADGKRVMRSNMNFIQAETKKVRNEVLGNWYTLEQGEHKNGNQLVRGQYSNQYISLSK